MLDLTNFKSPLAVDRTATQAKYTLSEEARQKLRIASAVFGHDMSTILELLVMTQLHIPSAPAGAGAPPAPVSDSPPAPAEPVIVHTHRNIATDKDFNFDD